MNNEPIAWMHKESGQVFAGLGSPMKPNDFIPLYTTPQDQADRIAELENQLKEANSVLDTIDCGDSIK